MRRTRSPSRSCSRTPGRSCIPACSNGCRCRTAARSRASIRRPTRFETDFATHKADVGNVIPPQRAGRIAALAGVADRTGWCPIDPVTFESTLQPGIHVIGDAAIARRHAEIGVRRQRPGQGLRRRGRRAAGRRDAGGAEPDQHLLQPGGARLRDSRSPASIARRTACWPTSRAPAAPARSTRRMRCARRKRTMPMAGSRPSPRDVRLKRRGGRACRIARWCRAAGAYRIDGDSIDASLTGQPGDPARGRPIVVDRQVGACLLCHSGPFPDAHLQGSVAPLAGWRRHRG